MKVSRGRCLLQERINELGINQAEYGRRTGRSKRMISHFCAGTRVMQPEDLYAAQEVFGLILTDLYELKLIKNEK
ncbi:transcriptional regulator with XRE-family HTH domain [Paenibacillus sp. 4624]